MLLKEAEKEYLAEIEIRKYTQKTIKSYRNNINLFIRYLQEQLGIDEVEKITLAEVKKFTSFMVHSGKKGTYINGLLKSIKSWLQYLYDEGYGAFDTKKQFKWCQEEKPVILTFEPKDVKKIMAYYNSNSFVDIRNRAILTTLFETGCRCWELCCIQEKDIYDDYIIIHGKWHKDRAVPITPVLQKALLKYTRCKRSYFTLKITDDFYFLSHNGKQLNNSAVEYIIKKAGQGIEGIRVSPHTCRHFFAQQQLKMGTDLYTISRLLGHENVGITQTYLNSFRDKDIVERAKNRSVLLNL